MASANAVVGYREEEKLWQLVKQRQEWPRKGEGKAKMVTKDICFKISSVGMKALGMSLNM